MHLSITLLLTLLPASLFAYPSNRLDDITHRDIVQKRGDGQGRSQAKDKSRTKGKGKAQGKGKGNGGNSAIIIVAPTPAPVLVAPPVAAPPVVAPPVAAPPAVESPVVEAPAEGEEEVALPGELELPGVFGTPVALGGGDIKQDVVFTAGAIGKFEYEFQGLVADQLTVIENTTPATPPAGFVAIEPNSFKVSLAVSKGAGLTLSKIDYIFDVTNPAVLAQDITKAQVGKLCTETNTFIIDAALGELEFEIEENEVTLNLNKLVVAEGEFGIFLPVAGAGAVVAPPAANTTAPVAPVAGNATEVAAPVATVASLKVRRENAFKAAWRPLRRAPRN